MHIYFAVALYMIFIINSFCIFPLSIYCIFIYFVGLSCFLGTFSIHSLTPEEKVIMVCLCAWSVWGELGWTWGIPLTFPPDLFISHYVWGGTGLFPLLLTSKTWADSNVGYCGMPPPHCRSQELLSDYCHHGHRLDLSTCLGLSLDSSPYFWLVFIPIYLYIYKTRADSNVGWSGMLPPHWQTQDLLTDYCHHWALMVGCNLCPRWV